ncbi:MULTISPECIES: SdpI family protein [Actinoalloteichus]|uniref:SdpI/YhfL protein family n=1 Tax=Actinoalloteichus fjordicus TaxID=1612552 RepID=A0AAC9LHY9_9PSEU|nr:MULTISPECIES: SdpI family protein [Actinoalloteichus]APU18031.1 SdpI/YhfL protein family [Actinoalloteichus fjordicus]APU24110.1 SdpI/YhfL protein family [Actinoalloteichus sp. GBA129-24]
MTNAESIHGSIQRSVQGAAREFAQATTAEPSALPLAVAVVLSVVLLLAGAALLVIGWRGMKETLPRNRFAGVRTAATLRSDEAFRVGNRAAGLPTLVSGAIGVLTAVGLLGLSGPAQLIALGVGVVGLLGLTVAGGVLGTRAAATVKDKPARTLGCAGQCCGNGACGIA